MIFSIAVAITFAVGALVCYASFCAAARADRMSEEYWQRKIAEKEAQEKLNKE
jgi:hypothetical protein